MANPAEFKDYSVEVMAALDETTIAKRFGYTGRSTLWWGHSEEQDLTWCEENTWQLGLGGQAGCKEQIG